MYLLFYVFFRFNDVWFVLFEEKLLPPEDHFYFQFLGSTLPLDYFQFLGSTLTLDDFPQHKLIQPSVKTVFITCKGFYKKQKNKKNKNGSFKALFGLSKNKLIKNISQSKKLILAMPYMGTSALSTFGPHISTTFIEI